MTLVRADVYADVAEMTSAMTSAVTQRRVQRVNAWFRSRRNLCRRVAAHAWSDEADSFPMT